MDYSVRLMEGADAGRYTGGRPGCLLHIVYSCDGQAVGEDFYFLDGAGGLAFATFGAGGSDVEAVSEALKASWTTKPYSAEDPPAKPAHRILARLGDEWFGLVGDAVFAVREFVRRMDAEVLRCETGEVGRRLRLSEYRWLARGTKKYRCQAVSAFPFLLHTLVASEYRSHRPEGDNRIVQAVDTGQELVPLLAAIWRVRRAAVRVMAKMPAAVPARFSEAIGCADTDPATVARAIDEVVPDRRPRDECQLLSFRCTMRWTEMLLSSSGGVAADLVPPVAARIWSWRPFRHELPDLPSLAWLDELAEVIRRTHRERATTWSGNVGGREAAWLSTAHCAVLQLVWGRQPAALADELGQWRRTETPFIQRALIEHFARAPLPQLPIAMPSASGGWMAEPITAVAGLVETSREAANCLALYAPGLLRREAAVFELRRGGELVGHFEIVASADGTATAGQALAPRNRPLPAAARAVVEQMVAEVIVRLSAADLPFWRRPTGEEAELALAVEQVMDAAAAEAHRGFANDVFEKARATFGLVRIPEPRRVI